jgi:SAM-dependent methyltransferase
MQTRSHLTRLVLAAVLLPGCSKDDAKQPAAAEATRKAAERQTCNICGKQSEFQSVAGRPAAQCPKCQSRERHRLLMHYLQHHTPLPTAKLDVLQFSPMAGEKRSIKKWKNLNYKSADYVPGEDLQLDLTALTQPDASWDVLIAYHILEHIPDDKKAMSEMFRVLRPGGQVILQVPIEIGGPMVEDPTITDPKAREKAFGQHDHVRKYSESGLRERLEATGFVVEIVDYLSQLDPAEVSKHSMRSYVKGQEFDQRIWLAKKPSAPAEPTTAEPAPAEPTTPEPTPAEPTKKTPARKPAGKQAPSP